MIKKDLLIKTLLTQAFADAFGYLIEFDNLQSINMKFGSRGPTVKNSNQQAIYISDDTQMSLFALYGILLCIENNKFIYDQQKITSAFIDWLYTQYNPKNNANFLLSKDFLYFPRAPGNTCLSALKSINNTKKIYSTTHLANDSKGCGGIMRTLPFAFFANNDDEAWHYGCEQAAITHGHINGYTSAGFYTVMCFYLLHKTNDILEAYDLTKIYLNNKQHRHGLQPYLNTLDNALTQFANTNIQLQGKCLNIELGEGWIGDESLIIAIYCAATSNSLASSIEVSSIHNGDSDSTAMLCAGLYQLANPNDNLIEVSNLIEYNDLYSTLKILTNEIFQKLK